MKKLLYILPVALVLSGCTLFPNKTVNITGTENQKAEKLAQIMSSGGQADCRVTNLTDKSVSQIIISGKKMKFVGSNFGEGKKGTMINDGVYSYIWSEGEKTGFKTKLEPETSPSPTTADLPVQKTDEIQTAQTYEDETKFETFCARRTISDSEFTPPADVNFTDFSEMMKGLPTE